MAHTTPLPNTLPQKIRPTTPSNRPQSNSNSTLNSPLPSPQSNHTLQNNLPFIYQPTAQANTKPITRNQHGIFKPNQKYYSLLTHVTKSPLLRNPVSALKDPNWKMVMHDEYNDLIKNETWDLVPRPPDVNVIRPMWIFRHKENSDGSFERHKTRLLGNGAGQ